MQCLGRFILQREFEVRFLQQRVQLDGRFSFEHVLQLAKLPARQSVRQQDFEFPFTDSHRSRQPIVVSIHITGRRRDEQLKLVISRLRRSEQQIDRRRLTIGRQLNRPSLEASIAATFAQFQRRRLTRESERFQLHRKHERIIHERDLVDRQLR